MIAVHDHGWRARLNLEFEAAGTRTILARRRHDGPLLIQRPFYPEGNAGTCHTYIIHPPGGVVGGDDLALEVGARGGTSVLLTTPAAGKFYRRGSAGPASVRQTLRSEAGTLEWLPQENIFYPNAEASVKTLVILDHGARFFGWEIACLGLPAIGASLDRGAVQLRFELWRDGGVQLIESLLLTADNLESRSGLAGFPVFGTLIATPASSRELDLARACAEDCAHPAIACTLIDGILACRALALRADRLRSAFERLWQVLRPEVLGRRALAPRIWAT
jgi:urease accessory protein